MTYRPPPVPLAQGNEPMQLLRSLALLAALASPALAGDVLIKKEKHSDAVHVPGFDQPAQDTTETVWLGKGRLRSEEGKRVTIVRADLKKLYLLDTQAKTYTALDLPLDMKKYMPADMAPMMEQMGAMMKVTVTPATESRVIKGWNATKVVMTTAMPMGGSTQTMWVTKDVALDMAVWKELSGAMMLSANPFGGGLADEMKKIDGFPVLIERSQTAMGNEVKSSEAVVSIEEQEPPAGTYDLPEGYTEKPFDPMAGMTGGPGHAGRGPRGG
jgi:hypothetical protein